MAENSKIEWTTHTFNPWVGCTALSPACDHCYAEGWAKRTGNAHLWQGERRRTSAALWRQPLKWDARCATAGIRERVFCASLADVFDNQVPAEWRRDLFDLIWRAKHLDWMLLTKRPENIAKMLPPAIGESELWPRAWSNIWLGTTVEDRARLRRIDVLRRVPAAVRFLSIEPLLEDLGEINLTGIHLVIVGGESGPGARPMHPAWARSIRDQCEAQGVPYFFKQWGDWLPGENLRRPWDHHGRPAYAAFWQDGEPPEKCGRGWGTREVSPQRERAGGYYLHRGNGAGGSQNVFAMRVGKKAAGRLLDGVEHNGMPEVRHG